MQHTAHLEKIYANYIEGVSSRLKGKRPLAQVRQHRARARARA